MNTTFTNCAEKKAKQFLNLLQGYTKGIRMTAILVLLLMGVNNAWAGVQGGEIYFDAYTSKWTSNLSTVEYVISHDSYSQWYKMAKISNTQLYYISSASWGDAKYIAFTANFGWTSGEGNSYDHRKTYGPSGSWYTAKSTYGVNSGSTYLFYAASASNDATITTTSPAGFLGSGKTYTALNYTQTVQQHLSTDGGSSYAVSTTALATVKVSSYQLNSKNSTTSSSGTIASGSSSATCSAARTATVTYTVSGVKAGYTFVGWYDGNTQKSTSTTYTYPATGAKTITARFGQTYAVTISAGANGTVSPTGSQQVGPTSVTIKATANTGYKFKNWTTTGGVVIANATNATTTITATAAGTVKANFEEDLSSNWKLIGDNQTNSPFGDNYTYSNGKAMTKKSGHSTESNVYITLDIKHLPASYYGFKVATSNSDNDKYGYGTGEGHYITFNRSASNTQKQVYSGSQHELKFIPDALGEYEFRVNYPNSKYVYVTFPTAYTVTFGKGTGGSSVTAKYSNTSFSSGKKVQSGKTVTFTQTASAGYTFKEWNTKSDGTGTKLSTNATYTHTVAATNTVYAIYTKNPDNIVYLKPSHSWKSNNAQFAVKYGGTNHMMTEVEECCEEKYYKVIIPSQYSKFNFVRLSDNGTTEWNVTGEISVPTDGKNLYDMTKIYLEPNANWKSDGARFAAYFFVNGYTDSKKKWMSMLSTDEDGVFYCDFPTEHTFDRVSLTRMNGAESYNDWAYRLNQTKDIDLFQGYNSYELEEGKWGKDNSNPQVDDNMNVIYKCKWTTYNPTYSVTLEPTPYGHYTVEYNGRTYKSATDKNVVIEDVALGATIRVSKGTPDNSAEYTDDMLLQKASGSGKTELKGGEYYDHTICGTTTITENFVTKNPHTVYLRVPTTIEAAWNDDDQGLSKGANCVYYTHIMAGGIHIMDNVTNSINGEDGYSYYQLTIPAGYRTFCFQRKSESTPQSYSPRNYTKDFTHILPFINGLNCFTILGSHDDEYYYGEWGTLLQTDDYRLLYIEQKVELENGHPKTTVTKAHPSDIIKYNDTRTTYSLHIYNKVENGENGMNDPEILVQQWNGSNWITKERHMVFGPLHANFGMAAMPGRRNADGDPDAVLRYDDGIENIKNDINTDDPRFVDDQASGVWNFIVTRDGSNNFEGLDLTQTARYEGDYYVRTDCAVGGWDRYTLNGNHMTRSDISKRNSNYSHYFCKWIGEAGVNVRYTIANDYGHAISDTLEADRTDLWGVELEENDRMVDDDQLLPAKANVRFSWNEKTDSLHRAYIAGSTNVADRFLVLEGKEGELYNAEGEALTARSGLNANEEIFSDISNWVYQTDVQMIPNASLKVTAKYYNKTQYFIGKADEHSNTILQGTGTQKYLIRLLYDFKINELVSAYVPGGNNNIEPIQTNLMLIRKGNNDASQLNFNTNDMKEEGQTAYGVIEFPYELLNDGSKDIYQRSLYWISFPFDVNLQDAFGVGQYGVHWLIQEYDGARRAEEGLWAESDSFWKLHWDQNITLKAGFGYVIELDISKICTDFEATFNEAGDCIAIYFPSAQPISGDIVKYPENNDVSVTIPAHKCTIPIRNSPYGNRQIRDSHWNVIGVPSYVNAGANFSNSVEARPEERKLKFYYKWNTYDNYEVVDANANNMYNDKFKSMFAYMVQYEGDLKWKSIVNDNTPQGLAARQNADYTTQEHNLRLELQQKGTELDRTFITLQEDDVTAAFDFNYDLCKVNNGGANIYSLIATDTYPIQVAGNVLPVENNVIPVGVIIRTAGEYTFAMPEGTDGIVVELIDYEANTTTNLLFNDYTVSLPKGTFENRFALSVKPDKTATSLENIFNEATGDEVKKFIIDGVLYMQKDGVLYDAQGHIVR